METQQTNTVPDNESDVDVDRLPWYKNWKTWLKISIVLGLISFIVVLVVLDQTDVFSFRDALNSFIDWMSDNAALGSFVFIVVYFFCTVMFVPGAILTLGAGAIYWVLLGPGLGTVVATLVVFVGASAGASVAFLLARFVLRGKVASYKKRFPNFDVVDRVVAEQGFKVTLLLRLSPIIPFNAFNYFMGLTGVPFRAYVMAHIGMLPGTIAYCAIGGLIGVAGQAASNAGNNNNDNASGGDGSGGGGEPGFTTTMSSDDGGDDKTVSTGFDNLIVKILAIVGSVLAIAGMVYVSWIAKKEFNRIAEAQQQEDLDLEEDEEDIENGPEHQHEVNDNDIDPLNKTEQIEYHTEPVGDEEDNEAELIT